MIHRGKIVIDTHYIWLKIIIVRIEKNVFITYVDLIKLNYYKIKLFINISTMNKYFKALFYAIITFFSNLLNSNK